MSRKQWKLSDFDKYLKPMHLAGKQTTLTIMHVGVEQIKNRKREFIIAGEAPEEQADDLLLVLHFREYPKPLRVNNMNRGKLREFVGDDPAALIGRKITIRAITLKQFGGQEAIDIVSIEKVNGQASAPAPQAEEPDPGVTEIAYPEAEGDTVPSTAQTTESAKANGSDFGRMVYDLRVDQKTVKAVLSAYTVAGVTDWDGAIRELKAKAK